jgi:hypothetical protein
MIIDLPDSVRLQVIERQFGMDGLSRWAKVPKQTGKGLFDLIEWEKAVASSLKSCQSV